MRRVLALGMVVAALSWVGCGGSDSPDTGARAGPPSTVAVKIPPGDKAARHVVLRSGCLACHKIGEGRHGSVGRNLTHIGAIESRESILRTLKAGPSVMPSFKALGEQRLNQVASYLAHLK
jgi:menaquinol-cytochrome c reductase cytochrome b/c subunit